MKDLFWTLRVVGLRKLLRLSRARRVGWEGILSGLYTSRTIQALFNVGFFDELERRSTINLAGFAESHELDLRILQSLCDSLFSLRILNKENLDYSLTPKGELLVEVARGWFDGVYGYEKIIHNLEGLLTGEKEYGRNLDRRLEHVDKGRSQIEKWIFFPLARDLLKQRGARRVLDLGCGRGAFLTYLCQGSPEITGYGIDVVPEMIAAARENTGKAGLEDRIRFSVADARQLTASAPSLNGIDAAVTFFLLHEILFSGEDALIEFLTHFRSSFPGVPMIAVEAIRPTPEQMRRKPGMAIQYFLHHDLSNQKPVSRENMERPIRQGHLQGGGGKIPAIRGSVYFHYSVNSGVVGFVHHRGMSSILPSSPWQKTDRPCCRRRGSG